MSLEPPGFVLVAFLCEEGAIADLLASICNSKIDRAHLCAKV